MITNATKVSVAYFPLKGFYKIMEGRENEQNKSTQRG